MCVGLEFSLFTCCHGTKTLKGFGLGVGFLFGGDFFASVFVFIKNKQNEKKNTQEFTDESKLTLTMKCEVDPSLHLREGSVLVSVLCA